MNFTLEEITAHLPPEQLEQGWELFNRGKITAPNVQRGGELITAVIPQSGRPIRIYIRTSRDTSGVNIKGECSCLQNGGCEHIAAVLLQALEDEQPLPNDSAPSTPTTKKHVAPKRSVSQQALLYVLQIDKNGLLVETYVARRLKQGGYSTGQYYSPGRSFNRTPARFLEEVDLELLTSLEKLPRDLASGLTRLEGKQAAQLLEIMVNSGRCFFEDADDSEPLRLGAAQKLDGQWQTDKFGCQTIEWITDTSFLLLPLSSPWYIDFENSKCGPLNSDLPA
ncbi:SWIM zinc finger domain-containing protein, partial [Pseudomonadota bacterium]